ncbi:non-specific lipid-transfer protein 1 [Coffea arabica]|uniref:Non-specific lipid-transfer protein n=1 Tax=Coffea arabica TaxID=13443 RepID=A0A6P6SYC1_COFAR|nr:non-specific lipid-transfer protein 1-like [Coffea arabica]
MAKHGGLACFALVILCMAVLVVPHAEAITCGQVSGAVGPCINYVRNGGVVPPSCCGGIRSLVGAAKTPADRRTACGCLKAAAARIPGLNPGLAAGLPGKCGVRVPFPISTSVDCSRVN